METILKVVTRNGSSVNGKPRVFVAYHKEDKGLLDDVIKDVFACQDCAIFYRENYQKNVDKNELEFELGQMSLMIIPITANFLKCDSDAYTLEFKFAIENNIPVLPLMYGKGLENLFNQKCGDLQFLDKFAKDETAIDYQKKLDDFLSSILVSDELANKIREAFSSRVFLSYRKKDRRQANELMKRIHSVPELRDVAIWYDEYLTPGENFNEEIKDALNKSELFALLVTPNLINEVNYVMTHEYPLALSSGKAILPAETVATDHTQMKEKYKNLPNIIDGTNTKDLSEAMLLHLGAEEKVNDDEPQHIYLIGLAYLNGIDVEVDKEKGFILISEAAEKGDVNALKKIAHMYYDGEAVKPDLKKALFYQKKLVEELKKQGEASIEDGSYASALGFLGAIYQVLRDFKNSSDVLNETIKLLDEVIKKKTKLNFTLEEEQEYAGILADRFIAVNNLARVMHKMGEYAEAERLYLLALSNSLQIFKEEQTILQLKNRAYSQLGVMYAEWQHFGKAEDYTLKALEIERKLYAYEPEKYEPHIAGTLDNLGAIYISLGKLDEAVKLHLEALEIYQKLLEQGELAYEPQVVVTYDHLGLVYQYKLDMEKSAFYFQKAYDLYSKLVRENIEAYGYDFTVCCGLFAQTCINLRNFEKADKLYKEALKIIIPLAKTGVVSNLDQEARLMRAYAQHLVGVGKVSEAMKLNDKAIEIHSSLLKKNPNISKIELAHELHTKGVILKNLNRFDEAIKYLKEALKIRSEYAKMAKGVYEHTKYETIRELAFIYFAKEDYQKAEPLLLEDTMYLLAQTKINLQGFSGTLIDTYIATGFCNLKTGNLKKCAEYFSKAEKLAYALCKKFGKKYLDKYQTAYSMLAIEDIGEFVDDSVHDRAEEIFTTIAINQLTE